MTLYRITWEWDEYLGAGEYISHKMNEYVLGNYALGVAFYIGMLSEDTPVHVAKIRFTFQNFYLCLHHKTVREY